jgi:hypothetical protein
MATINTGSNPGIVNGNVIYAQHVLPIVYALNGTSDTDLVTLGNFTFNGTGKTVAVNIPLNATQGTFSQNLTASVNLYVGNQASASLIQANRITGSVAIFSPQITGSNILASSTLAFGSLGAIISGSGSVPLLTHTVTQSAAVGNQLTFGGGTFRDYLFLGQNSPRVGIGSSATIGTASLASGSFILNLPSFTPTPATLLVTSSDAYVMKVATNTRSQSFAISGSGQVGINTWSPREALDVQNGNAVISNTTTTSGSIFYVENVNGRSFEVTNEVTNSIFTVQTIAGQTIMDVGTSGTTTPYVAITGNGGGITPALSSSFNVVSGSISLAFRSGSTVTAGPNDVVIVATSTVTLPTASTAGVGRYYIVRNAGASPIGVTAGGSSTVSGITSLGATSASQYISDGVGIWYSI